MSWLVIWQRCYGPKLLGRTSYCVKYFYSHQPRTRPYDKAIRRMVASLSSWGNTLWYAELCLPNILKVKSSEQRLFFFLGEEFGGNLFLQSLLNWGSSLPSLFDLLAVLFTLILMKEVAGGRIVPLAAARARRAFLCLIPQALQRDCAKMIDK